MPRPIANRMNVHSAVSVFVASSLEVTSRVNTKSAASMTAAPMRAPHPPQPLDCDFTARRYQRSSYFGVDGGGLADHQTLRRPGTAWVRASAHERRVAAPRRRTTS